MLGHRAKPERHRYRRAQAWKRTAGMLLVSFSGLSQLSAAAQSLIIHPRPESLGDERAAYPIVLLKLSSSKVGNPYRLAASPAQMQQGRALRLLARGQGIDLLWTVMSREREAAFLPIRIPIDRGLNGWRLLLIRAQDRALFAPVATATGLAPLRAGQSWPWPARSGARPVAVATGRATTGRTPRCCAPTTWPSSPAPPTTACSRC